MQFCIFFWIHARLRIWWSNSPQNFRLRRCFANAFFPRMHILAFWLGFGAVFWFTEVFWGGRLSMIISDTSKEHAYVFWFIHLSLLFFMKGLRDRKSRICDFRWTFLSMPESLLCPFASGEGLGKGIIWVNCVCLFRCNANFTNDLFPVCTF